MPGVGKSAIVQQVGQARRQCPAGLRHQLATDRNFGKEISQRQCQFAGQELMHERLVIRVPAAGARRVGLGGRTKQVGQQLPPGIGRQCCRQPWHATAPRQGQQGICQRPRLGGRIVEPAWQDLDCPAKVPAGKMRPEKCGDLGRRQPPRQNPVSAAEQLGRIGGALPVPKVPPPESPAGRFVAARIRLSDRPRR